MSADLAHIIQLLAKLVHHNLEVMFPQRRLFLVPRFSHIISHFSRPILLQLAPEYRLLAFLRLKIRETEVRR